MRYLLALALLCSLGQEVITITHKPASGGGGTWSVIQHVTNDDPVGCRSQNACATTVSSTGANHVIFLLAGVVNGSSTSQITFSAGTGGGTFANCSSGTGFGGKLTYTGTTTLSNICGRTLASTSGTTSINLTVSSSVEHWGIDIVELAWSGSTIADDSAGFVADSSGSTSLAGVGLTLSGSSDVICQMLNPENAITAITGGAFSSPAFSDFLPNQGVGFACAINTTTGTAPTWTSSPSGQGAASAVAVKGS